MEAAVVILNWNGLGFLQKFLPSLIDYTPQATLVVIDNQSTDESVCFLQENHPEVEIIINQSNGGFAKGYNKGLQSLKGRFSYYVLINSDIEVTPNWLSPLYQKLEQHKEIAAVQPKIRSYHHKNQFEYAGAAGGYIDKNLYPFCRGRIFDEVEKDVGQYNTEKEVFWTSGACMMIRSDVFHTLGGFDEDFFAHMEEIDLCWRIKKQNHALWIIPSSCVYHVGGGTLNYENPKKTYLNFRNSLFMIHKNYNGFLFGKIFYRLCLDGVAGIKFLVSGKSNHVLAILKAHFSYYRSIRLLNKKRSSIQKASTTFNHQGYYNASILWAYYFKKIKVFKALNHRFFSRY